MSKITMPTRLLLVEDNPGDALLLQSMLARPIRASTRRTSPKRWARLSRTFRIVLSTRYCSIFLCPIRRD